MRVTRPLRPCWRAVAPRLHLFARLLMSAEGTRRAADWPHPRAAPARPAVGGATYGVAETLATMVPCVIAGAVLRILSQLADLGLRCPHVLPDLALQFLRRVAHNLASHFLNLAGRFFGSTLDLILV